MSGLSRYTKRHVGIDPSTKTGLVAMDDDCNVTRQKELEGMGKEDPMRMCTLINEIMDHVRPNDVICIEGFGFASQQAVQNGGIGWGIRMALYRRGIKYYEVAPASLKKFCGAGNQVGADGKKLKGKAAVAAGVYEHWGYSHPSDNVIDAYVLAQIAYAIEHRNELGFNLQPHQIEVINLILKPKAEKKADKAAAKKKKLERAATKAAGEVVVKKTRSRSKKPADSVLF